MSFTGAVKVKNPQKPSEPMSLEDVDKSYKEMLVVVDAYRDDKLTMDMALTKLKPLNINKDVLIEIYNKFLDRRDNDRENLMMLVCKMLQTNRLTCDDNLTALIGVMELAPDVEPDVPRVYEYIAQFFGELKFEL
jgi:hypothetical protein